MAGYLGGAIQWQDLGALFNPLSIWRFSFHSFLVHCQLNTITPPLYPSHAFELVDFWLGVQHVIYTYEFSPVPRKCKPCLRQPKNPKNAVVSCWLLVLVTQLFSKSLRRTSWAFHFAVCPSSSSDISEQGGRSNLAATHGSISLVPPDIVNISLVLNALLLASVSCYPKLPAQQEDSRCL